MTRKNEHQSSQRDSRTRKARPRQRGYEPPCIQSISTFDTMLLTCKLSAPMGCTHIATSRSA